MFQKCGSWYHKLKNFGNHVCVDSTTFFVCLMFMLMCIVCLSFVCFYHIGESCVWWSSLCVCVNHTCIINVCACLVCLPNYYICLTCVFMHHVSVCLWCVHFRSASMRLCLLYYCICALSVSSVSLSLMSVFIMGVFIKCVSWVFILGVPNEGIVTKFQNTPT